MDSEHFNAFYEPFLQASKIKNIYKIEFKGKSNTFKILTLSIPVIGGLFLLTAFKLFPPLDNLWVVGITILFLLVLQCITNTLLKVSVETFRKKYKTKFAVQNLFSELKYYVWNEFLGATPQLFSVDKALAYVDIELSGFDSEKYKYDPFYMTALNAVTIVAVWRFIDDAVALHKISGSDKLILDSLILYVSYQCLRFIPIFRNYKQRRLLLFKQYLLRLKSQSSINVRAKKGKKMSTKTTMTEIQEITPIPKAT